MYADRRPTDSMKSTWRNDPSQWKFAHRFLNYLNAFHNDPSLEVPVHAKTDKMPCMSMLSCNIWILLYAAWPMAIQYLHILLRGRDMHPVFVFLLYTVAMQVNSIHEVRLLRRLGHRYGFLDGDKHARDEVPDVGVGKVLTSLQLTTSIRPMLAVFLSYRRSTSLSLSVWLPVELFLYSIVLDGFFYVYHRSCHELDGLWQYHRTHHLTKHPNPLLSSYADHEQELFEIALIPLLTYATLKYVFGLPMGFHDWWICHEFIIFSEAFGHSGLRIYSTTPGLAAPFLQLLGCELAIEDHDLHHRKGWRKSTNYGKQTRLWDRIFGTCGERIEAVPENVDYGMTFNMPLY
jgi:sterol desaturase/sphingolipid hydroxylase (fatty acid hydroxylase superfamily)